MRRGELRAVSKDFGKNYNDKNPLRPGSEDHKRHLRVMEKHVRLHNQDWKDVVIVNMHPFPLYVNLSDAGDFRVKKCPEGAPYNAHVIDTYRLSMSDKGNADFEPVEILPVEQAQECERQYRRTGGVFWYFADEPFPAEKLKTYGALQLDYYRALVRKGRDEWARYHQMGRISESMRQAALYLSKLGELNINDYEWVEKPKLAHCEQCGEDRKPGANICRHCEFPFNHVWVWTHRKDLARKFGIKEPPVGATTPLKETAEGFLDGVEGKDGDEELV